MRVLVTGAGDFLGRRLIEALRRELPADGRVLGIDRHWQPPLDGVEALAVDPVDGATLSAAVVAFDPTHVLHLAALASVSQASETPAYAWRADLLGSLNLAEAVARTRAVLVFVSSTVVYGEAFRAGARPDEAVAPRPDTISGRTKNACELILRDVLANAGIRHVVLRPANYIGLGQSETFVVPSFAGQIARIERGLSAPVLEAGNLSAARDFVDVSDVAAACLVAIERAGDLPDGAVFNVGSGTVTPVSRVLGILRGLAAAPFAVRVSPDRLRPAGAARQGCDPAAFAAATGWRPKVPLADSLAAILADARARAA